MATTVPLMNALAPDLASAQDLGPLPPTTPVDIVVPLDPRDPAGLETFIEEASNPASPAFQHWLTTAQVRTQFGPNETGTALVTSYLAGHGFSQIHTSASGLLLTAHGTNAAVANAFAVSEHSVRSQGTVERELVSPPLIPSTLAPFMTTILGLDNRSEVSAPSHAFGSATPQSTVSNSCCGLSPAELNRFYDASATPNGTGETIVIAGVYDYKPQDIEAYDLQWGLPDSTIISGTHNCTATGSTGCTFMSANSQEVTLDVEMAHGIAPGAKIVNYMAGSPLSSDLIRDFDAVVANNTGHIVSLSWGTCEVDVQVGLLQSVDTEFMAAAAEGQTWFVASGDDGAHGCGDSQISVDWPADSPHAVAVGGTNATCSPPMTASTNCSAYGSEQAWPQSGGGASAFFDKPTYQTGCGVPNDGMRDVPDVASVAGAPNVWEYYNGGWALGGGTSDAAPQLAARFAAIDQSLGGKGLGMINKRLYELCGTPAFHDITTNGNDVNKAGVGYDKITGVGTLDVNETRMMWVAVPPSAPRSLAATGGTHLISLNWTAPASLGNAPVTLYHIYRGSSSGAEGTAPLATVGTVLTYNDTTATPNTTYYYRVSAVNSGGNGPNSSEISATTLRPPGAPTNLAASGGNGRIALSWNAPSFTGTASILTYTVYRGSTAGHETLVGSVGPGLSFIDTSLGNGQTEFYRVTATNIGGEGNASSEASATTWTTPGAVGSIAFRTEGPSLGVIWTSPVANGGTPIVGYRVFRGAPGGALTLVATVGNGSSWNDTTVAQGTTYEYAVQAVNAVGPSATLVFANGTSASIPGVPLAVRATGGNASVQLDWAAPTTMGGTPVIGYVLSRSIAAGGPLHTVTVGNVTSYLDPNLNASTTYAYTVAAVNLVGVGPASSAANATTLAPPAAPGSLMAKPVAGAIDLTWSAPTGAPGAPLTYVVDREVAGGARATVGSVVGATTFQDTGVRAGTSYTYEVAAADAAGVGPATSATTVAADVPGQVQGLSSRSAAGSVVLTWSPPVVSSLPLTGFAIARGPHGGATTFLANIGNTSTFTDTTPAGTTPYDYTVAAMNALGAGPTAKIEGVASAVQTNGAHIPGFEALPLLGSAATVAFLIRRSKR
ncbi:MAG: fibronectin type III domain-containing protein [Thermoplasmatota archaeon]